MIFTEKYIKMNKKVKDSFLREKKEQIQQLENRVGEKEILYMYTFFWPFVSLTGDTERGSLTVVQCNVALN